MAEIRFMSERSEVHQCCPDVRFLDGRLQQMWNIQEIQDGKIVDGRREWRDVPHVEDELEKGNISSFLATFACA